MDVPDYSLAIVTLSDPILIQPSIDAITIGGGTVDLDVSQLTTYGLTTDIERATSLEPENWTNVWTFVSFETTTNWSETVSPSDPNVSYRANTLLPED